MSSATSDSTESAHAMQQDKTKSSADSFALLVKPFDAVEDDRDSPASRAYPKVLDINSPTGTPTNKKVDTDGPGGKDKDSHRPWPKPYKHQNGSKRNRDTIKPMPLGLPGHKQDDAPLQRWLREPSAQGPYHGIADAVENPCQAHSTKDNNTKHHRS